MAVWQTPGTIGPLGVEFKNNVKRAWWQKFVQESKYNVGVDCAILMNREVWVASGHVGSFNDPLIDCKACKSRYRADQLIEQVANGVDADDGWSNEKLEAYIAEHHVACPQLRQERLHRHPQVQPDVQDLPGRDRGQPRTRSICVPKPHRASSSTSRMSQRTTRKKRALRHRTGRQILPQRDHSRQLHLPHPRVRADGAGVLLQARRQIWNGSNTGAPSAATGC